MPTQRNDQTTDETKDALVLFNRTTSGLPAAVQKAIERTGMKLKTRELPGVEPSWKPTKPGEYVIGEVIAIRENTGEFAGTVVVISDQVGKVPVSVWLGADLKTKLAGKVRLSQVYCITYMGKLLKKDNPKLKNDMNQYQVVELLPDGE